MALALLASPLQPQDVPWKPGRISRFWNLKINPLEFREPLTFIPYDIKAGLAIYGGPGMFDLFPISLILDDDSFARLDSTESEITTVRSFIARFNLIYDIEVGKINVSRFLPISVVDVMVGAGFRGNMVPFSTQVPAHWDDAPLPYRIAPTFQAAHVNMTINYQRSDRWYVYFENSWGYNWASVYRAGRTDRYLKGTGSSKDYALGIKILRDREGGVRSTVGLELRYLTLDAKGLDDNLDISPIEGLNMRSFGVFITYGIAFGGRSTAADKAKRSLYAGDYMSAADEFFSFLQSHPRHAKKRRARKLLALSQTLIPYQQIALAKGLEAQGKYDEALKWYDEADLAADTVINLAVADGRADIGYIFLKQADDLLRSNDLTATSNLLRSTKLLLPKDDRLVDRYTAEVLIREGHGLYRVGNYTAALMKYDLAISTDPSRRVETEGYKTRLAELLLKEALTALDHSALSLAIQSLKMSRELDPGSGMDRDFIIGKLQERLEAITQGEIRKAIEKQVRQIRELKNQLPPSRPRIGMLIAALEDVLGKPDRHTATTDKYGVNYQMWYYSGGKYPGLYYLENYVLMRMESLQN